MDINIIHNVLKNVYLCFFSRISVRKLCSECSSLRTLLHFCAISRKQMFELRLLENT